MYVRVCMCERDKEKAGGWEGERESKRDREKGFPERKGSHSNV